MFQTIDLLNINKVTVLTCLPVGIWRKKKFSLSEVFREFSGKRLRNYQFGKQFGEISPFAHVPSYTMDCLPVCL